MNIETVNELIQSLESAGELSIKETKVLELAREFKQLAAENVSMRKILGEVVYSSEEVEHDGYLTFVVSPDSVHDAADLLDGDTPATDRIVAGIKADGVEEFVSNTVHKIFDESEAVSALAYLSLANSHVKQLREGGRQMSKSFIVIIRRAWCNEGGHGIEYSSDLIHYETRNGAISHGFRTVDSDDFNIGVIEGGKLISFDWMDKPVGESEDTLAQIAELIGLEDAS